MDKQSAYLTKLYTIWGSIVVVWAIYRAKFVLPEVVDEFFVKPLVFLGPVLYFVLLYEKRPLASIGWQSKKLMRDVYLGVGFAAIFTVLGGVANFLKYGTINLNPIVPITGTTLLVALILSIVTSFVEESLVRGFLFSRLVATYRNQFKGLVISTLMYLVILTPIILTRLQLTPSSLMILLVSNIIMSAANSMIYYETRSIALPVFIHAFWNMSAVLYL